MSFPLETITMTLHQLTVHDAVLITSVLSLVASIPWPIILQYFKVLFTQRTDVYMLLSFITVMAIGDCIASIGHAPIGLIVNDACQTQGIMQQFGEALSIWAKISIQVICNKKLCKCLKKWYLQPTLFKVFYLAVLAASLPYATESYDTTKSQNLFGWCWISSKELLDTIWRMVLLYLPVFYSWYLWATSPLFKKNSIEYYAQWLQIPHILYVLPAIVRILEILPKNIHMNILSIININGDWAITGSAISISSIGLLDAFCIMLFICEYFYNNIKIKPKQITMNDDDVSVFAIEMDDTHEQHVQQHVSINMIAIESPSSANDQQIEINTNQFDQTTQTMSLLDQQKNNYQNNTDGTKVKIESETLNTFTFSRNGKIKLNVQDITNIRRQNLDDSTRLRGYKDYLSSSDDHDSCSGLQSDWYEIEYDTKCMLLIAGYGRQIENVPNTIVEKCCEYVGDFSRIDNEIDNNDDEHYSYSSDESYDGLELQTDYYYSSQSSADEQYDDEQLIKKPKEKARKQQRELKINYNDYMLLLLINGYPRDMERQLNNINKCVPNVISQEIFKFIGDDFFMKPVIKELNDNLKVGIVYKSDEDKQKMKYLVKQLREQKCNGYNKLLYEEAEVFILAIHSEYNIIAEYGPSTRYHNKLVLCVLFNKILERAFNKIYSTINLSKIMQNKQFFYRWFLNNSKRPLVSLNFDTFSYWMNDPMKHTQDDHEYVIIEIRNIHNLLTNGNIKCIPICLKRYKKYDNDYDADDDDDDDNDEADIFCLKDNNDDDDDDNDHRMYLFAPCKIKLTTKRIETIKYAMVQV